ncbi:ABC transporter ATP-binding protein [Streptomyces sp. CAI-121]|uniref:ABC transporter ATP-binding protein n=1 Tax=unclassified Streptomyces TaxID=2593676 RepID=UPI00158745DE|nr:MULTISPECIES: ABC transporter ATP-binding protein [unclassified Streptomyces]NUV70986.1 ABC transporter ATP-binding protein [Streptomyces sp. CAI-121]NUW17153.1 ABC transporter ATP-binding protein [Streptomyces sp. CAI-68]
MIFSRSPADPSTRLLRRALHRVRGAFLRSVGWAALRQSAFLAMPWLLGRAVDAGVESGSPAGALLYGAAFLAAACVEYAGMRGWQLWATLADNRAGTWLRSRLLKAVLAVDTDTLQRRTRTFGDLTTRATRDVDTVLVWIHGLTTWVVIGLTALVLVPAIGGLDPLLLLVAAATVPVLLLLNRVFPPLFGRRAEQLADAHGARSAAVDELLTALLPLRGVGGDRLLVERHHRHSAEVKRRTLRLAAVGSVWEAAAFTVPLLAVTAGLLAGGLAVADGRITVGALTTFVLWMGTVSVAVNALIARLGDLAEARVAAGRIARVLDLPAPARPHVEVEHGGVLRVDGLTVRRTGRAVVGPLNLEARPGEWLALTGPTGCGKSTLLRAVAQLVPASGTVTLGGVPLESLDPEQLYRLVGFVPEGPLLLHGTIADNLLLPGPRTPAELATAARTAGLDPALSALADGLDTQVGERGGALSGGQRQRVTLARALLRDCPVLLLDDVTSALDDTTEAEVLDRLRHATADRIVILAGYSPAVLARADREIALPAPRAVPPTAAPDRTRPDHETQETRETLHG